jgi:hypothetical protein
MVFQYRRFVAVHSFELLRKERQFSHRVGVCIPGLGQAQREFERPVPTHLGLQILKRSPVFIEPVVCFPKLSGALQGLLARFLRPSVGVEQIPRSARWSEAKGSCCGPYVEPAGRLDLNALGQIRVFVPEQFMKGK